MFRPPLPCALAALALVCACTSHWERRGDRALELRRYAVAADYYARALEQDPHDPDLQQRLWTARARALDAELDGFTRARRQGSEQTALRHLRAALRLRDRWVAPAQGRARLTAQRARIDTALSWAAQVVTEEAAQALHTGHPLVARKALQKARSMLDEPAVASEARDLKARVQSAGERRCAALRAKPEAANPHVARQVERYCASFGLRARPVPPAPEQLGAVSLIGGLQGAPRQFFPQLRAALNAQLRLTPWYSEAAAQLPAIVGGQVREQHTTRTARREAHWLERVAYQATEVVQVPYSDLELYYVQEPYTDRQSYSCGSGTSFRTCTRSVTRYRSVQKSRWVTKYRNETRQVTRYRSEPRTYTYNVLAHSLRRQARLTVTLDVPSGEPVRAVLTDDLVERSDEHNVTFAPASVTPKKPSFSAKERWLARQASELAGRFREELVKAWVNRFCAHTDTLADAARCAHGTNDWDASTIGQLTAFLEDDARLLRGVGDTAAR